VTGGEDAVSAWRGRAVFVGLRVKLSVDWCAVALASARARTAQQFLAACGGYVEEELPGAKQVGVL